MLLVAEHWSIGSHLHNITIALHSAQMHSLYECAIYISMPTAGGIFAEINLRSLAVVVVVVVLIVDKPSHALIVMLIHDVNDVLILECECPSLDIVGRWSVKRTGSAAYLYIGIFLSYRTANHLVSLLESGRYNILITNAYVFEIKRSRMSGVSSHLRPFACGGISIRPLYHVEDFLDICRHVGHRNSALLSAISVGIGSRVLTRHTGSEHRQRFGIDVFTELEVLIESQSSCLMIIPYIAVGRAFLQRSHGVLPPIYIIQSVAMTHTSAWESHKLRMEIGNHLCEISAQSVLASLECVLRKETDHIHESLFLAFGDEHQSGGSGRGRGRQSGVVLRPFLTFGIDIGACQHAITVNESYGERLRRG